MKIFELEEVGAILQRLSDSGINANLSWFDLEGFDYILGNSLIGFQKSKVPIESNCYNIAHVVSLMCYEAAQHFPDSSFAEWYKQFEVLQD